MEKVQTEREMVSLSSTEGLARVRGLADEVEGDRGWQCWVLWSSDREASVGDPQNHAQPNESPTCDNNMAEHDV